MDDPRIVETVDPEEAFALLADDTRVEIVRALWEREDGAAAFSELREVVGVSDSGQFNYHLDKLAGRFVERSDEGYELSAAGIRVVGALLGGAYTMEGSVEPVALDEPCPSCGEAWALRYEDGFATIACDDCSLSVGYPIPPSTFAGAPREDLPDLADRYLRTLLGRLRNRLCPYCESAIRPRIVTVTPPEGADESAAVALVEFECTRCTGDVSADLATPLLDHPDVVAFFRERGVDPRDPPVWRFAAFGGDRTAIASAEPLRATVDFEVAGDRLTLTVDESLTVLDVEEA